MTNLVLRCFDGSKFRVLPLLPLLVLILTSRWLRPRWQGLAGAQLPGGGKLRLRRPHEARGRHAGEVAGRGCGAWWLVLQGHHHGQHPWIHGHGASRTHGCLGVLLHRSQPWGVGLVAEHHVHEARLVAPHGRRAAVAGEAGTGSGAGAGGWDGLIRTEALRPWATVLVDRRRWGGPCNVHPLVSWSPPALIQEEVRRPQGGLIQRTGQTRQIRPSGRHRVLI